MVQCIENIQLEFAESISIPTADVSSRRLPLLNTGASGQTEAVHSMLSMPFSQIIEEHRVPERIDYLSLDVEGHEAKVMATFPWKTHRISLLSVERPPVPLSEQLRKRGYHHICSHGLMGDQFWVHDTLLA